VGAEETAVATAAAAAATGGEDAAAASAASAAAAAVVAAVEAVAADREAGSAAETDMGCQGGMAASHTADTSNDFFHVVKTFFLLVYIAKKNCKKP
jgi:hypothetical protein